MLKVLLKPRTDGNGLLRPVLRHGYTMGAEAARGKAGGGSKRYVVCL